MTGHREQFPAVIKETTVRNSARRGFTLIELLVVIGIILLLVSITVFGLRHVNATAARHETFAEMNICEGMLKEYENVNGFTNVEGTAGSANSLATISPPGATSPPAQQTLKFALPIYLDNIPPNPPIPATPPAAPSFIVGDDLSASASGDFGDRGGPAEPRYIAPVIARTQCVMYILLRDPKNRAAISAVPARRILELPPDPSGTGTLVIPNYGDYSMVLDGWGNPIIYVPKGGMVVWMNPSPPKGTYFLVRSSGTYQCDPSGLTGLALPAVGPNDHPFFASAGQDGIFTDIQAQTDNGIDNIYSFQQ